MPYKDGVRISQAEYVALNSNIQFLHTGPSGANPAPAVVLDEETSAPVAPKKAGSKRSKSSTAKTKAAVANALGVDVDSAVLEDIDMPEAE